MHSSYKKLLKLRWALVRLLTGILGASAQAATNGPALEFVSIPPFGSTSNLIGRVSNVKPADFRVAVYIYVGGWYNKPFLDSPLTDIQTNGGWTCDITTGGNDPTATRIAAFLIPSTNSPPIVNGANVLPAQLEQLSVAELFVNRYATELSFSGYRWEIKDSGGVQVGPDANYFSSATNNVWVDVQGRLHLRITKQSVDGTNRWSCPEVVLQRSLGYGTYRISVDSRVDNLDPNVVLGFFTWSDDPAYNHRELDCEFSRWGNASDPNNAQYVVQPDALTGNLQRFQVPTNLNPSTCSFKWQTNLISFLSMTGYYYGGPPTNTFISWTVSDSSRIPLARDENGRINLWLLNGLPPANGQEIEVIINRFVFVPLQIPPPILTWGPRLTNGAIQLQLKGFPQLGYYIQCTTNLTHWSSLGLVSSPDGQPAFVDTSNPTAGRCFYLALAAPQ